MCIHCMYVQCPLHFAWPYVILVLLVGCELLKCMTKYVYMYLKAVHTSHITHHVNDVCVCVCVCVCIFCCVQTCTNACVVMVSINYFKSMSGMGGGGCSN